jgi:hypothetical protein
VSVLSLGAVVIAVLNLPEGKKYGLHEPDYAPPVMRDLARQVGSLADEGTLLYDARGDSFYYQFYSSGLLAELRRRGIPFVTDDEPILRSLGEHRRFTGDNADAVVTIRTGDAAHEVPRSAGRRVALHEGLRSGERQQLARLRDQIREYLELGGLPLNPQGERSLERLGEAMGPGDQNPMDAEELLSSGGLLGLYQRGFLALDEPWTDRFARWASLQVRSNQSTVAVFVAPRS